MLFRSEIQGHEGDCPGETVLLRPEPFPSELGSEQNMKFVEDLKSFNFRSLSFSKRAPELGDTMP